MLLIIHHNLRNMNLDFLEPLKWLNSSFDYLCHDMISFHGPGSALRAKPLD